MKSGSAAPMRAETRARALRAAEVELGGRTLLALLMPDGRRMLSLRQASKAAGFGDHRGMGRIVQSAAFKEAETRINGGGKGIVRTWSFEDILDPDGHECRAIEWSEFYRYLVLMAQAHDAGLLHKQSADRGHDAKELLYACGAGGLLVHLDEALDNRNNQAPLTYSEQIAKAFLANFVQDHRHAFPPEFFQLLWKLRGWGQYQAGERRLTAGNDVNLLVYTRIAPGVLDEIRKRNERRDDGSLVHVQSQHLNAERGHPRLREVVREVMSLMRLSVKLGHSWSAFVRNVNLTLPRFEHDAEVVEFVAREIEGQGFLFDQRSESEAAHSA